MKYRDFIILFLSILFILSLVYTIGVDIVIWPVPIVLFVILGFFVYKLYIER